MRCYPLRFVQAGFLVAVLLVLLVLIQEDDDPGNTRSRYVVEQPAGAMPHVRLADHIIGDRGLAAPPNPSLQRGGDRGLAAPPRNPSLQRGGDWDYTGKDQVGHYGNVINPRWEPQGIHQQVGVNQNGNIRPNYGNQIPLNFGGNPAPVPNTDMSAQNNLVPPNPAIRFPGERQSWNLPLAGSGKTQQSPNLPYGGLGHFNNDRLNPGGVSVQAGANFQPASHRRFQALQPKEIVQNTQQGFAQNPAGQTPPGGASLNNQYGSQYFASSGVQRGFPQNEFQPTETNANLNDPFDTFQNTAPSLQEGLESPDSNASTEGQPLDTVRNFIGGIHSFFKHNINGLKNMIRSRFEGLRGGYDHFNSSEIIEQFGGMHNFSRLVHRITEMLANRRQGNATGGSSPNDELGIIYTAGPNVQSSSGANTDDLDAQLISILDKTNIPANASTSKIILTVLRELLKNRTELNLDSNEDIQLPAILNDILQQNYTNRVNMGSYQQGYTAVLNQAQDNSNSLSSLTANQDNPNNGNVNPNLGDYYNDTFEFSQQLNNHTNMSSADFQLSEQEQHGSNNSVLSDIKEKTSDIIQSFLSSLWGSGNREEGNSSLATAVTAEAESNLEKSSATANQYAAGPILSQNNHIDAGAFSPASQLSNNENGNNLQLMKNDFRQQGQPALQQQVQNVNQQQVINTQNLLSPQQQRQQQQQLPQQQQIPQQLTNQQPYRQQFILNQQQPPQQPPGGNVLPGPAIPQLQQRSIQSQAPSFGEQNNARPRCQQLMTSLMSVHQQPVSWLYIKDSWLDAYVFSAFYQRRGLTAPVVRVVGISNVGSRGTENLRCQMWVKNSPQSIVVAHVSKVTPEIIPETRDMQYGAVEYLCEVPTSSEVPVAVSLVMDECEEPANILPVIDTYQIDDEISFGVCVPPLHYNYNDVYQFVEMVEVNRMFGAKKLIMYNHTLGPDILPYINSYVREGVIDLIPWQIPVRVDTYPPQPGHEPQIHYFGQLAALNDCLYRMRNKARYIVFTDLDEFAVPRLHRNWRELIQHVQSVHGTEQKIGAFSFRNTFFKLDYPSDEEFSRLSIIRDIQPRTLLKTRREPKIFQAGVRSKYIVDSRGVDIVGIHNVWKFNEDYTEFVLPVELGLVHHYRFWDTPEDTDWVEDKNMRRFTQDIIVNVKQRFNHVTSRT